MGMSTKPSTATERILNSAQYIGCEPFTCARMNTALRGYSKGAVASALSTMVSRGLLEVKRVNLMGNQTNVYSRPKTSGKMLRLAWVSTPTSHDFTPRYC